LSLSFYSKSKIIDFIYWFFRFILLKLRLDFLFILPLNHVFQTSFYNKQALIHKYFLFFSYFQYFHNKFEDLYSHFLTFSVVYFFLKANYNFFHFNLWFIFWFFRLWFYFLNLYFSKIRYLRHRTYAFNWNSFFHWKVH
jgi:hypothetical protein